MKPKQKWNWNEIKLPETSAPRPRPTLVRLGDVVGFEAYNNMNCWHCNHELIWGGDHDFEDYQMEGEGIVTNLSCPECDAMVLVYSGDRQTDLPIKNEEE